MIQAVALILCCQLAGELAARALGLPLPGPVLGAALLFGWLALRKGPDATLESTADGLLAHLSLLFVPAGVGVMLHAGRLREEWLPILAALLVSTVVTMAATALVFRWLARADDGAPGAGDGR